MMFWGESLRPELSVILPFCDVELYLDTCLESIARQTFSDLEVVMVDDGSRDASRAIAQGFVDKDDRFHLVCQKNRGPGAARNTGMRHAQGRYVAFADGDDIVARTGYEQLIGSLRETGSDLACGGVYRFDRQGSWPSLLHSGIFDEARKATHITERTELLGDRTVWNKVYCRSFLETHGLSFPEHAFEDASVAVPAHVLARAVDVMVGPVYFWRSRDDGPQSLTQRLFESSILDGRMQQVRTVSAFLAEHSNPLKVRYDLVALEHDILILLVALPYIDATDRKLIVDFASRFLETAAGQAVEQLSGENRECYQLVRERRLPELLESLSRRPKDGFL